MHCVTTSEEKRSRPPEHKIERNIFLQASEKNDSNNKRQAS